MNSGARVLRPSHPSAGGSSAATRSRMARALTPASSAGSGGAHPPCGLIMRTAKQRNLRRNYLRNRACAQRRRVALPNTNTSAQSWPGTATTPHGRRAGIPARPARRAPGRPIGRRPRVHVTAGRHTPLRQLPKGRLEPGVCDDRTRLVRRPRGQEAAVSRPCPARTRARFRPRARSTATGISSMTSSTRSPIGSNTAARKSADFYADFSRTGGRRTPRRRPIKRRTTCGNTCGPGRYRTDDTRLVRPLLYQLSYGPR